MGDTGRKNIYWNSEELHKLLPRVHELTSQMPAFTVLAATRLAQKELLPRDRQRQLADDYHVIRLARLLDEYRENLKLAREVGFASDIGEKARAVIQGAIESAVRKCVRDELLVFEERLFKRLAPRPLLRPVDPPTILPPRPLEVTKLAKILIVGLLPEQEQTIIRRYSSRLELRFARSGVVSLERIKDLSSSCDATFGMVRFIGHHLEDAINRRRYIRVLGALSDLEVALNTHIKELEDGKNRKTS